MVGAADAKASVMMAPEADQVKISICPGVSTTMCCSGGCRGLVHRSITYTAQHAACGVVPGSAACRA